MRLLTVNAGSTSLKLERYEFDPHARRVLGDPPAPAGRAEPELGRTEIRAALDGLLRGGIDRIAHRFVQLPDDAPAVFALDPVMLASIREASLDDSLHGVAALQAVDTIATMAPDVPQYGISDSAFHRTMPAAASTFALPHDLRDRYHRKGYHGLSHEYAIHRACALSRRDVRGTRIVTAHLGGGSSLCAARDGASIDTTMGWSSLDGLPMATRCGALDPGIVLHLARCGAKPSELTARLEREAGLLGISGRSGDVRALIEAGSDPDARLALDVLAWRTRAAIGASIATLGGLDILVFTGGIGEHAPTIRAAILENGLGADLRLDSKLNAASREGALHAAPTGPAIVLVNARENWMMAHRVVAHPSAGQAT